MLGVVVGIGERTLVGADNSGVFQFNPLDIGRHTPVAAHILRGGILLCGERIAVGKTGG